MSKLEQPHVIDIKPTIDEYQLIWENTNDAIFILQNDGSILQANPALLHILGWSLKEIEGVSRPPFFMDEFTPEDHENQLNVLRSGESIHYFETKRKHKDGTEKDILASYRAINKDNVLAVAMYKDITLEKKTQRKLGIIETCYQTLVEYSPDAIVVQSNDKLTFANPEAVKLFGAKDLNQIIGKPIWDFIESKSEDYKSDFEMKFRKFEISKNEPMIEKIIRDDGNKIWVEIIAIPVKYDGETVIQAIIRDVTVRKYYEDQLLFMATHDALTGVVNRNMINDELDKTIDEATNLGETFAVLYIDTDKFKGINDLFGHEVGDELLIQLANRLNENVRSRDVVGRIGGDEFLILLKNADNSMAESIVKRMLDNISRPYLIKGKEIISTLSIGIAMYPVDGNSTEQLMSNADQALYKAKEKRNHFLFYKKGM